MQKPNKIPSSSSCSVIESNSEVYCRLLVWPNTSEMIKLKHNGRNNKIQNPNRRKNNSSGFIMNTYLPIDNENRTADHGKPGMSLSAIQQKQNRYQKLNSLGTSRPQQSLTVRELRRMRQKRSTKMPRPQLNGQTGQADNLLEIPEHNEAVFQEKPLSPLNSVIEKIYNDLAFEDICNGVDTVVFEDNESLDTGLTFDTAATTNSSSTGQEKELIVTVVSSPTPSERSRESGLIDVEDRVEHAENSGNEYNQIDASPNNIQKKPPREENLSTPAPVPPEAILCFTPVNSSIVADDRNLYAETTKDGFSEIDTQPKPSVQEIVDFWNNAISNASKGPSKSKKLLSRGVSNKTPIKTPTSVDAIACKKTVVMEASSVNAHGNLVHLDLLRDENNENFEDILEHHEDHRAKISLVTVTDQDHTPSNEFYDQPVDSNKSVGTATMKSSSSIDTFGFAIRDDNKPDFLQILTYHEDQYTQKYFFTKIEHDVYNQLPNTYGVNDDSTVNTSTSLDTYGYAVRVDKKTDFEEILIHHEDHYNRKSFFTKKEHELFNQLAKTHGTNDDTSVNTSSSHDTFGFFVHRRTPDSVASATASVAYDDRRSFFTKREHEVFDQLAKTLGTSDDASVNNSTSDDSCGFIVPKRTPDPVAPTIASVANDGKSLLETPVDPSSIAVENGGDSITKPGTTQSVVSSHTPQSFESPDDEDAAALLNAITKCPSHNDAQFADTLNFQKQQLDQQEKDELSHRSPSTFCYVESSGSSSSSSGSSSSSSQSEQSSVIASKARKLRTRRLIEASNGRKGFDINDFVEPIQEIQATNEEAKDRPTLVAYPSHSGPYVQVYMIEGKDISCQSVVSDITPQTEKIKPDSKWDDMSSICVSLSDQEVGASLLSIDDAESHAKIECEQEGGAADLTSMNDAEAHEENKVNESGGAKAVSSLDDMESCTRIDSKEYGGAATLIAIGDVESYTRNESKECGGALTLVSRDEIEYRKLMGSEETRGHNIEEPPVDFDASIKTPPGPFFHPDLRDEVKEISVSRDPSRSNESKWDDCSSIGLIGVETIHRSSKPFKTAPRNNQSAAASVIPFVIRPRPEDSDDSSSDEEEESRKARNDIFRKHVFHTDKEDDNNEGQSEVSPTFSTLWGDGPSILKEKAGKKSFFGTADLELNPTFSTVMDDFASYYSGSSVDEDDLEMQVVQPKNDKTTGKSSIFDREAKIFPVPTPKTTDWFAVKFQDIWPKHEAFVFDSSEKIVPKSTPTKTDWFGAQMQDFQPQHEVSSRSSSDFDNEAEIVVQNKPILTLWVAVAIIGGVIVGGVAGFALYVTLK